MSHAVLVIEDEPGLARNIQTYLQHHDFEVRLAHTAEAGIAQVHARRPDVVVLDHGLPDLSGLQALARIRAVDAGIPVLMVTGEPRIDVAVAAMKGGAVDCLRKPLALDSLRLRLEQVLALARQPP